MKKNKKCSFIVITGFPNAGKSTLLNSLIKNKVSIVSSKVQTTKDEISGILNIKDTQLIFTDTPGLISNKKFNQKRISRTILNQELKVDKNLFIHDVKRNLNQKDILFITETIKKFKNNFLILNKIDLIEKEKILEKVQIFNSNIKFKETFIISARKKEGINKLLKKLILDAPIRDWIFPSEVKTDKTLNFQISEITREKIFHLFNKEIPYSVEISTQFEKFGKILKVYQDILVKKDSQKSILIGKKGEKIKMIGSRARIEMQRLVKNKIFLSLRVKKKD